MSLATQRNLIETAFMSAMDISEAGIIMIGENADTPAPDSGAWIRMSFTLLDIRYPCVNNYTHEETDGIFNVQVFTPLGEGAFRASRIVDNAKAALRDADFSDSIAFINFDAGAGVVEADWYSILLRATYRAQT